MSGRGEKVLTRCRAGNEWWFGDDLESAKGIGRIIQPASPGGLEAGCLPGETLVVRTLLQDCSDVSTAAKHQRHGFIRLARGVFFHLLRPTGRGLVAGWRTAALVRFQLRHLPLQTGLCEAEGFGAAECREAETVDLFVDNEQGLRAALEDVEALGKWVPEFEVRTWTAEEAREKFEVNQHVVGAISYKAGALWPCRLVSQTQTSPTSSPRLAGPSAPGTWCTPPTRTRATSSRACAARPRGVLAHMSAQRPGADFPRRGDGALSWGLVYGGSAFDYVTQRPGGGGFSRSAKQGGDMVGVYDDSRLDALTAAHLEGIVPPVLRPRWGADEAAGGPRVKSLSGRASSASRRTRFPSPGGWTSGLQGARCRRRGNDVGAKMDIMDLADNLM
ncbi:hypothetical protein GGTG_11109 [Gaeumannomyces tritici R3-111a-1]|uniref:Uncharacterized protein n=1 Tax=Gaeumannomyces tritici (strain R3-111a-1) TaxID=644352 RepID=J3PC86_GAET3|nr:hypothetical protein GGTG_11109 [Gaeumannomyces tritici R3-111a-1]EJT71856.1 hypothetical protein GGTG_11109 [Gaeumannomyces tritici R3-111a-1]